MIDFAGLLDADHNDLPDCTEADGDSLVNECPHKPGSPEAKAWWNHAEKLVKQTGRYQGKALIPGESGPDQGDFNFLVDRLQIYNGYSEDIAKKIAGKIAAKLG